MTMTKHKTSTLEPCAGSDPLCPCQDGDICHYKDAGKTKAWFIDASTPFERTYHRTDDPNVVRVLDTYSRPA